MNKTFIYCIIYFNILLGSCSGNHSSNEAFASQIEDSLAHVDSLNKYNDSAWLPNRNINAELIGWDSTVNLALSKTFSQEELLNIYKQKAGSMTVFCYFDKQGKVKEACIDYCEINSLIKKKFNLLLKNFEKCLRYRVDEYYIEEIEKGKSFYTTFLIVNLKLFSVDEIGSFNDEMKTKFEVYNDTTRKCK